MRPLLLLTALLLACGTTDPTPDGLEFATDGSSFEVGGPISVALSNATDEAVGYNFCQRYWERKVGATWEKIEELFLCIPEYSPLDPGSTAEATMVVPYTLPEGTYRMNVAIQVGDELARIRSNEFTVEPGLNR